MPITNEGPSQEEMTRREFRGMVYDVIEVFTDDGEVSHQDIVKWLKGLAEEYEKEHDE